MKSFKYLLGAVAISASLGAALIGGEAQATVHSGRFGTSKSDCWWYFDDVNYVFTVASSGSDPSCRLENANKSVWQGYADQIKSFVISSSNLGVRADWNMDSMFADLKYVENFDFSGFNTSAATSMVGTFFEVGSLGNGIDTLDLSGWNTSNVTDMMNAFARSKIKKLVLGNNFNTSKVTDFTQMFYGSAFEELSLNFNTTSTEHMGAMFADAKELKTLDISSFAMNGSSPIEINEMFDGVGANVAGGTEITINNAFERPSDAEWAKYSFPEAMYDVEIPFLHKQYSSIPTEDINGVLNTINKSVELTIPVILTTAGSIPINPTTPSGASETSSPIGTPDTGASAASRDTSSVVLLGCILTGILLSLASLPLALRRTKKA